MEMMIYADAYFRKLIKSTSVMLRLKLPRVLKFTLAGREFHTLTTLSAKKHVASTVVAMRCRDGLAMTKFKNAAMQQITLEVAH